jgi:cytochrome bd-type quinol oxidase subunit 2
VGHTRTTKALQRRAAMAAAAIAACLGSLFVFTTFLSCPFTRKASKQALSLTTTMSDLDVKKLKGASVVLLLCCAVRRRWLFNLFSRFLVTIALYILIVFLPCPLSSFSVPAIDAPCFPGMMDVCILCLFLTSRYDSPRQPSTFDSHGAQG